MLVLGIETSCDETAAAVVRSDGTILSNVILSQLEEHRAYGGVVPEIAARAHIQHLDRIVAEAMQQAGVAYQDLTAIAATGGPGLIGGVMVGVMTAKAIAAFYQKPFLAVNHLEGHALTVRMASDIEFPFLLLLVSGGHCQMLIAEFYGTYRRLGSTKDDALGEAFDKVAKMLGLGYPGGPQVEAYATRGNPDAFSFPKPLYGTTGCDFSFSGLKTAVNRAIAASGRMDDELRADICASFQRTVTEVLHDRLSNAMKLFLDSFSTSQGRLVIAGGVAANQYIRKQISHLCETRGFTLFVPPARLCTDNAAMIAWAGIERLKHDLPADTMDFEPKARWPIFT